MAINSAELLQKAISHHQAGEYADAEQIYLEIIHDAPRDADANHNLGMLRVQQGRPAEALALLNVSLEVNPARAQYWVSYINTLISAGEEAIAKDLLELAAQYGVEKKPFEAIRKQLYPSQTDIAQNITNPGADDINHLVSLFNSGNEEEAEKGVEVFIQTFPEHALGWKVKGTIFARQARNEEAEAAMRKAILISPEEPEIHNNLGSVLMSLGRDNEAIASFVDAIRLFPEYAEAYNNLGNAQVTLNQFGAAIDSYNRALLIRPEYAEVHYNLGTLLQGQGNIHSAVSSYRRALEIRPDFAEASYNLAGALKELKQLPAAIACYKDAIAAAPDYADAYFNLGLTLKENGQPDDAISSLRRAIEVKPDFANAYNMLGISLHEMGALDESASCYRKAISIEPRTVIFHNNLGLVLHDFEQADVVLASYHKAIEINPNYANAYNNLGLTLYELGQHDEAIECYQKCIELDPELPEVYCNYGTALRDMGNIDEAIHHYIKALQLRPSFENAYDALLFCVNYHPDLSGEEIYAYYREYQNFFGAPFLSTWKPHTNQRDSSQKLRIGYVAASFHSHACRHFLQPLLANHDRQHFEIYAYAQISKSDEFTESYKQYCDHWIPTRGMTDDALAERIRSDGIDVLVDISGHTAGNRLQVFARKPAPVSLHWLDFGYTTGLEAIDYYLTDDATIPEGSQQLFSETPWKLPGVAYAYRPAEGMGEVNTLPAKERGYVTFGTLTRAVRINEHVIRVWSEILKATPNARLVVNSGNYQNIRMKEFLLNRFVEQGIAPERLAIGCDSPPWDVLRGIDIGLDCFPHNSGTTLFETLYMGIPFVTLANRPSVGRLGASVLHGLGHPEWIAETEAEYIFKAVALAADMPALEQLRSGLRAEMQQSALMDEIGFTRSVEDAYQQMWKRWCDANQA